MRAIIVDDELACVETLDIELGAYCPEITVIGKYTDAEEGCRQIQTLHPDVVFLDIEMPKLNAFDILSKCMPIDFDVIFVTAYDQYAVRAFDFNAVDYLLKPVEKDKLIQAVDKVTRNKDKGMSEERLLAIIENIKGSCTPSPNIALPTMEGYEFVRIDKILYAQADSNYAHIHLVDGKKLILSKTLKDIERMLASHHFARIHQSYLVNLSHVVKYMKGSGGYVVLDNKESLNVSRSYKSNLINQIKGFS